MRLTPCAGNPLKYNFPNSNIIRLEQNYRSTKNILECASALIDHLKIIDNRKKRASEMEKTRNKGEWSELYTFLKIIVDRKT